MSRHLSIQQLKEVLDRQIAYHRSDVPFTPLPEHVCTLIDAFYSIKNFSERLRQYETALLKQRTSLAQLHRNYPWLVTSRKPSIKGQVKYRKGEKGVKWSWYKPFTMEQKEFEDIVWKHCEFAGGMIESTAMISELNNKIYTARLFWEEAYQEIEGVA